MAPSTTTAQTPSSTTDDSSTPTGEKPKEPGVSSTTSSTTAPATSQPMASNAVNPANKSTARKASAPIPSPVQTDWANNADLGKVRANTPLSAAHPRSPTNGTANGVPLAPPPPRQTIIPQPVEPMPRPARSKSDASTKSLSGKASAFKRMFGGGGGIKDLPSAFEGTPVPTGLEAPFSKISLTPAGGAASPYVNGARTPASERNDPFVRNTRSEIRERAGNGADANPAGVQLQGNQAAAAPARTPATKDNATPTLNQIPATPSDGRKTPNRPPSTDGRFTLNQLLGNGPRLSRKSSASSRRSDSSTGAEQVLVHGGYTSGAESVGGGKAGGTRTKSRGPSSVGGESTASLSQKYGFCDKAPLGKGATSVVRLAHKWDRKEEKLYAVK
ncbi:serine/threonine-protein kinase HAL4/sat4, partial [Tulasnella sp. 427]